MEASSNSGRSFPHEFKIRTARAEDVEDMVGLLGELFSIEKDFDVDTEKQRRGLNMMMNGNKPDSRIWVAEAQGRAVGMATIQTLISTAQGGKVGLVEDLVVAKGFRGAGIGSALLSAVEKWAEHNGLSRLQLLADGDNARALNFYGKHSWQKNALVCLRKLQ